MELIEPTLGIFTYRRAVRTFGGCRIRFLGTDGRWGPDAAGRQERHSSCFSASRLGWRWVTGRAGNYVGGRVVAAVGRQKG